MSIEAGQSQLRQETSGSDQEETRLGLARQAVVLIYQLTNRTANARYTHIESVQETDAGHPQVDAYYEAVAGYESNHLRPHRHRYSLEVTWRSKSEMLHKIQYQIELGPSQSDFVARITEPDLKTELIKEYRADPGSYREEMHTRDMEEDDFLSLDELASELLTKRKS